MEGLTTGDLKRIPAALKYLAAILVSVVGTALAIGTSSGRMEARLEALERADRLAALEQRIERLETGAAEDRREAARALDGIRGAVSGIQLDVARVCVKLKCKE